ncbi:MAG: NAD(P)-dependent glycerol-3-phosphate dehydrogenase [Alphaproteobacteria bacterium]|nr:NAD(P)-dependent glycerol-3-phosphate dehydrogenase [Alphaproteobacteria bacterium]
MKNISVLGAGAWGTALAHIAAANGKKVVLWAREPELIGEIETKRRNTLFLPDVDLNENITPTNDQARAVSKAEAVLMVIPAQYLRASCQALRPVWPAGLPAVICAKGIEQKTGALLSEILAEELPQAEIAVLSGPTFAEEAAQNKPTALTLACGNEALGKELVATLGTPTFRPYYSSDVIGVQIGGAVKNVMAIAAGIVAGKKLGDNARAALITRGLAEISRLAAALGGQTYTLMGLSGLGDLVLTANSTQSRNFTVGLELGKGRGLSDILSEKRTVAEGVFTAAAVLERAARAGVEMPICEGLSRIMNENVPVDDVIQSLFARPFKSEN